MTVKDSADSFRSMLRWVRTCMFKGRLHRSSQGGSAVSSGSPRASTGSRAQQAGPQLCVNPDLPMGHAGPQSQSHPRGTSTCGSELPVLIQLHYQPTCRP